MLVFLASGRGNEELNDHIAAALAEQGHECFIPQRDAHEILGARRRAGFDADAIARADLVLLVGPDVDSDVAWRAGYARALRKRTVMLCPHFANDCEHLHLFDEVVKIGTLDDVQDAVRVATEGPARERARREPLRRESARHAGCGAPRCDDVRRWSQVG